MEYKFAITNKWNNNDATKEIIRASKFLVKQIKKGWNPQEAIEQTENQYGFLISNAVFESFNRVLNKQ